MLAVVCLAASAASASAASVIRTIPVGTAPTDVSSDGTHVWVANDGAPPAPGTVTEIDAATGTVVNTIPAGTDPYGVSSDGVHVWVANGGGTVTEIDAASGTVIRTITVPGTPNPHGISSDGMHVWVADPSNGGVDEITAATGTFVKTILPGARSNGFWVSSDGTHVWATYDTTVSEIDAASGTLLNTIPINGSNMQGVSSDGTHVWVADAGDNAVVEMDAANGNVVRTIGVSYPDGVSSDGTHVWATNLYSSTGAGDTVTEIDAATGAVVGTIPVGSYPDGVSSDGSDVWVANTGDNTVSEIQTEKPTPAVAVTDNSSGLSPGGDLVFSATVTGSGGHPTNLPVTWTVTGPGGGAAECTATTEPTGFGDVSTQTCTIDDVSAGLYTATAVYPADSNYASAAGTDDSANVMAVTLIQGLPTVATVLKGVGYSNQLFVTNAVGSVSYTETASAASAVVMVGPAGTIHVDNTAPPGTYTVGGTDADSVGDAGTWSFTLTVAEGCGVVVRSAGDAPPLGTTWVLGQTIHTGHGNAEIMWPNGARLTLSENAQITCDGELSNEGLMQDNVGLLQGLFVWVSAFIGDHEERIQTQGVACICIRGSVFAAEVLPSRRLLVHVFEGTGLVQIPGKPVFTFPAGEGVLFNLKTGKYKETLQLPPGALSLMAPGQRPPAITALRAQTHTMNKPLLRFKLSETAHVKAYVRRGKHIALVLIAHGKKGANKLTFSKALPPGRYTVELDATHQRLTSIATGRLVIP